MSKTSCHDVHQPVGHDDHLLHFRPVQRTLRARYQLVDLSSGEIVLDATAASDAGIDVVSSEYATIAAEQTALENLARDVADRIVTNVAVNLRKPAAP